MFRMAKKTISLLSEYGCDAYYEKRKNHQTNPKNPKYHDYYVLPDKNKKGQKQFVRLEIFSTTSLKLINSVKNCYCYQFNDNLFEN